MRRALSLLLALAFLAAPVPVRAAGTIPVAFTAFPSTAISADTATAAFDGSKYNAAYVRVDITALTGTTPTVRIQPQALLPDGTTWVSLSTTTNENATGTFLYFIGRTVTVGGGLVSQTLLSPIPRQWRLLIDLGGTGPNATLSIVVIPVGIES